jgi:hypothetical protein
VSLPAHAAQLLPLTVGLRGHAAEDELLPIVIADLGQHHLERANLTNANRPHMTAAMESAIASAAGARGWLATFQCNIGRLPAEDKISLGTWNHGGTA